MEPCPTPQAARQLPAPKTNLLISHLGQQPMRSTKINTNSSAQHREDPMVLRTQVPASTLKTALRHNWETLSGTKVSQSVFGL